MCQAGSLCRDSPPPVRLKTPYPLPRSHLESGFGLPQTESASAAAVGPALMAAVCNAWPSLPLHYDSDNPGSSAAVTPGFAFAGLRFSLHWSCSDSLRPRLNRQPTPRSLPLRVSATCSSRPCATSNAEPPASAASRCHAGLISAVRNASNGRPPPSWLRPELQAATSEQALLYQVANPPSEGHFLHQLNA